MSKELIVEDKTYFFDCTVEGEVIVYVLYDCVDNWIATKTRGEVAHTLQLLNKRIKYDVQIAYDTLQNAQPETAVWVKSDNQADGINASERVLKLKYRVKGCPFHFEWCLSSHEDKTLTIQLPVNQVTSLVDTLPAKIEELLNVLQRKEQEIKQYRIEKGSLRRSTLATSDFDVEQFREEYTSTETNVKSLQKILLCWRAEHGVVDTVQQDESARPSSSCTRNSVKKEEEEAGTNSPGRSKGVNESPRNKKRKALQNFKTQMARTLQTSKKQLEYESQSQTLSESETLAVTAVEAMNLLQQQQQQKETKQNAISNIRGTENISDNNVELMEKRRRTTSKRSASSTPKPWPNSVDDSSSELVQEVPSKIKKISPISAKKINTRQRRREYESQGNMMNDITLIETPRKSMLHTLNDNAELTKNDVNKSAITTPKNNKIPKYKIITGIQNAGEVNFFNKSEQSEQVKNDGHKTAITTPKNNILKHNSITGIQNTTKPKILNNLEQPKNDLSAYVDSMLSQLEAIDKELQA